MASTHGTSPTHSNETLFAILGAAAFAVVVACLLAGNPFHAVRAAFTDVTRANPATPASGAPHASADHAPATKP